eukprot:4509700-Ditylum_brightwellii.AAC.1
MGTQFLQLHSIPWLNIQHITPPTCLDLLHPLEDKANTPPVPTYMPSILPDTADEFHLLYLCVTLSPQECTKLLVYVNVYIENFISLVQGDAA